MSETIETGIGALHVSNNAVRKLATWIPEVGHRAARDQKSRSRHDWCDEWILEGGVARADGAAIRRAANKTVAARQNGGQSNAAD
jgi:hypothetical protein